MSAIARCLAMLLALGASAPAAASPPPIGTPWILQLGLERPTAIALDAARECIFVADAKTGAVYVGELGALAAKPYLLAPIPGVSAELAAGMAWGAEGALYIADIGANEVVRYTEGTAGWTRDVAFASAARQPLFGKVISRPRDVAVTAEGTLLVLDADNARIVSRSSDGWGVAAKHPDLASAQGIGARYHSKVWVAATHARALLCFRGGTLVARVRWVNDTGVPRVSARGAAAPRVLRHVTARAAPPGPGRPRLDRRAPAPDQVVVSGVTQLRDDARRVRASGRR